MLTTALIAAAGTGARLDPALPKQFHILEGETIISRTIRAFQDSPHINGIIVAAPDAYVDKMKAIAQSFSKVKTVLAGGRSRFESVCIGINAADPMTDILLIHDGARPLISNEDIASVIKGATEHGACAPGVALKETVKFFADGMSKGTPDRDGLRVVQTPQGFKFNLIKKAYERARADGFVATDDTSVMEYYGRPVFITEGHYRNVKVTTKEDLIYAGALLRAEL